VAAELTKETLEALEGLPDAAKAELTAFAKSAQPPKEAAAAPAAESAAAPAAEASAAAAEPEAEAPKARPKTDLELEMEKLMGDASTAKDTADTQKGALGRARRKSKDLAEMLNVISDTINDKKLASQAMRALGGFKRERRNSRDLSDDTLKACFDKIDTDSSGKLNRTELAAAMKEAMGQDPTEVQLDGLLVTLGVDKTSGEIDFDMYKQCMSESQ